MKPDRGIQSVTAVTRAIYDVHEVLPDLRIGQMLVNAAGDDLYQMENHELVEKLYAYIVRHWEDVE